MRRHLPAAVLLAALAVLPACSSDPAGKSAADPPATVVTDPATNQLTVELTDDAVRRIGITTAPVAVLASGQPGVPLSAVLFREDGSTWVYTDPEPLRFVRTKVALGAVLGDSVVLTSGPAAGTGVVTVGAAELLGAELGVGGEQ
jgi:hypothetical protein